MINYVNGDIFDADVEALVNPVNTVGVMGKGLALEFKQKYPENYKFYAEACKEGTVKIGCMSITTFLERGKNKVIINFPTKKHWKDKSQLEWIIKGLRRLREELIQRDIGSVALPPLGCGLGGLNHGDVYREIEAILGDLDINIYVYQKP